MKISLEKHELKSAVIEYVKNYYNAEVSSVNFGNMERYVAVTRAEITLKKDYSKLSLSNEIEDVE
ncbi:hypothetical protein [Peribacillus loiseleuriae]|uniref:hypothetical protein n=1 Tax=Peribacillus loiseleuriae TaxID=1679170 RepID=UPI003D05A926